MYKIIVTDAQNKMLTQEFYNRLPDESLLEKTFYKAVKEFQTFVFINVEKVKYIEM